MTGVTLGCCAVVVAAIASMIGFIDHARCEFHEVFERAFNP